MNLNDFHLPSLSGDSVPEIKEYLKGLTDALEYVLTHLSFEENILPSDWSKLKNKLQILQNSSISAEQKAQWEEDTRRIDFILEQLFDFTYENVVDENGNQIIDENGNPVTALKITPKGA